MRGTVAGGALGAALLNGSATAQTSTPTTVQAPDQQAPDQRPPFDPTKGGHTGRNGTKEVLLTGDAADKITAAALQAVPGGTVERVENDAEGATFEAHMKTSDGNSVTVKLDADFKVISTENGHR